MVTYKDLKLLRHRVSNKPKLSQKFSFVFCKLFREISHKISFAKSRENDAEFCEKNKTKYALI